MPDAIDDRRTDLFRFRYEPAPGQTSDEIYTGFLAWLMWRIHSLRVYIKAIVIILFAYSIIRMISECIAYEGSFWSILLDIDNRIQQSHEVAYNSISMAKLAISVIVAGLSIASTLYLSLWDSLSTSAYSLCEMVKDKTRKGEYPDDKTGFLKAAAKANMLHFSEVVPVARSTFGIALFIGVLDLMLLFGAFFVRDQSVSKAVFFIVAVMSVLLSLFFFLGVSFLQNLGPVRTKLSVLKALALIDSSDESDEKEWDRTEREIVFDLYKKGLSYNPKKMKCEQLR